jgi:stage II sporulation protein M
MKELRRLLKRDWHYFLWISLILVLGIGIGANLPKNSPFAALIIKAAFRKLLEIKKLYIHAPLFGKIAIIWGNNIFASASVIVSGILFVFPGFILLENGAIIGILQKLVELKTGIAPVWFYLALAPHGIFELPAFIIACTLGIRFGLILLQLIYNYLRERPNPPLLQELLHDLRYYAVFLLVVLFFAAVLEVTVSPLLVRALGTKL